jgi:transcriptional regulator with XRE-family HTH domain
MESNIHDRLQRVYQITGTNANSLASLLHVSKSIVYNLDKKVTDEPSVKMLKGLETYAGISMVWFLNNEGPETVSERNKTVLTENTSWIEEKKMLLELLKEKDKQIADKEFMSNLFKIEKMKDPAVANFIKHNTKKGLVIPFPGYPRIDGATNGVVVNF